MFVFVFSYTLKLFIKKKLSLYGYKNLFNFLSYSCIGKDIHLFEGLTFNQITTTKLISIFRSICLIFYLTLPYNNESS